MQSPAKFSPTFWECPPPVNFTHCKAQGKHYHEPKHKPYEILYPLIGVRLFPLLRSRHKTPSSFLGGIYMDIRHPPNTLHDNHHVGFVHLHLNVVLEEHTHTHTHTQVHACIISETTDGFFFNFVKYVN